ncbi:PilC/PilY family type IV pilus protein [uncultured Comamonas sp.]|uniref:pilus assembly protein n=1 Tax=uncultured Comamonas sp. TaxID=114710 RepID=UPI0025D204E8|nr:PilC/PilY family type IV pilus protein [uncultured Comamonas sp.]
MQHKIPRQYRKKIIPAAIGLIIAHQTAFAVDLVQAPPGTLQPYVMPNVIISIDDSGSMNFRLDAENSYGATNSTTPNPDGTWPSTSRRMNVLKYSLQSIFDPTHAKYDSTLLPDRKIRLAWQAMNANNGTPGSLPGSSSSAPTLATNSMQVLAGNHRTDFLSFIGRLFPSSSTPSHKMFSQADEYMRATLNKNGPWASDPGETATPYLGCRRNYHIFMTDGRWNGTASGGSQDDNTKNITLPDGTVYGSTLANSRPKNQLYADSYSNTLADWAFKSWGTRLQTATDPNGVNGLKGTIQPTTDYDKAPQTENFGKDSANKDAILERFWNPRYNPATWPHMVTYTIGFSAMAYTWNANIRTPTSMVPFGYDGDFPGLVTGAKSWPQLTSNTESNNALDLWHSALNGRGRFYAVEKGEDLVKAFREIFQQINTQTDPDLTSTATSGSNNTRYDVGKYTGNYEPKNGWKGYIKADIIRTDGSAVSNPGWSGQNTADKLDAIAVNDRVILSWSDKWENTNNYKGGVLFKWASDESYLSAAQKLWLQKKPDGTGTDEGATKGQQRLNFLRGDRSLEGSETAGYTTAKPFRERKSIQGDIVNSIIWFTGAPSSNYPLKGYADFTRTKANRLSMIYVGGNDGMLHGFAASNGAEKIAYVPQGLIPSLGRLTDPTYNQKHRHFVDGSPMTGDVDIGTSTTPNWRTLLVGALGAGGKGYFVLDVTDPGSFDTATPSSLVKLDRTRSTDSAMGASVPNCTLTGISAEEAAACTAAVAEDRDIGNITATPIADENNPMRTTQITRMNNNRWAVVLGNGYNSSNQRPVLLIQYLDGAMELKRIPVTNEAPGSGKANDNGLSAPRLVDINGDGLPDVAYAGDNQGNMWKFDLTSADASNWGVALAGLPLFTATGPASLNSARTIAQPITAPPTVRANDRKMSIGTGTARTTVAVGGMMVAFGTGRNVTKTDETDRTVQTIYSVLDNTRYNLVSTSLGPRLQVNRGSTSCTAPDGSCIPVPRALGTGVVTAQLAQQTITELDDGQFGTVGASDDNNKLSASTWANYNGWYLDLPAVGERQLKPMEFYDGSNILAIYSQVPAKGTDVDPNVESCDSSSVDEERQYRTFINIMDGLRPSVQIVDKNNDGLYNALDLNVSRVKVSKGSHTLVTQKNKIADFDAKNNKEMLARMPEQSLRPSWRQLR